MIRLAFLAVLALLAGPTAAETAFQPELPEGYPPVMGDVRADVGGRDVAWQTFDFSIGAFDASAWMSDDDDKFTLRIMAYLPGQPDRMEDRIWLLAMFDRFPQTGDVAGEAVVEILAEQDTDGKRLTSQGKPAQVVVESFLRRGDENYGSASGTFSTEICWTQGDKARITRQCRPIAGRFDTKLQFENM